MVLGDFNEILLAKEKQRGLDWPEQQMQNFKDALDFYGLKDFGFHGFPFTWCNRRPGNQNVWIRLDRGLLLLIRFFVFPLSESTI